MRKILLLMLVMCFGLSANAQFNPKRLTFGGELGLQFGDYTLINIAPQVGYDFNKYMNLGGGLNYTYYRQKIDHDTYRHTNNYVGLNVYGRFYPISYIVLMVQPEVNRVWKTVKNMNTGNEIETDKVVPSCLVGAGIRLGAITAMIRYDLVQNNDSPYGNQIFYSVGYTFGF